MANTTKVWETVTHKWFGDQNRRLMLAIGHTIIDKKEAKGRLYLLVGPPATGKTTVLSILQKIFEDDPTVEIIWDIDGNKVKEAQKENKTVFCASNREPSDQSKNVFIIRTKTKSYPMSKDEYQKVVHIMNNDINAIRKDCCYHYVLATTSVQRR